MVCIVLSTYAMEESTGYEVARVHFLQVAIPMRFNDFKSFAAKYPEDKKLQWMVNECFRRLAQWAPRIKHDLPLLEKTASNFERFYNEVKWSVWRRNSTYPTYQVTPGLYDGEDPFEFFGRVADGEFDKRPAGQ